MVEAENSHMLRYRIATRLGLVEPLVRAQRRVDAAARRSPRSRLGVGDLGRVLATPRVTRG
jgi:hypothetical protein